MMAKNKNESAILRYDVLVLKRRGLTRDLPSGTESLCSGLRIQQL